MTATAATVASLAADDGPRGRRRRLVAILGVVIGLHLAGIALYLSAGASLPAAGGLAGAGVLAYSLGLRHAFDADHIAAIDDTTRLMLARGRRPVGIGFFFSLGHSTVVLALSVLIAIVTGAATTSGVSTFRTVGAVVAEAVAAGFLLLVAGLNATVLAGVVRLWRRVARDEAVEAAEIDRQLLDRGLFNRLLGGRARTLIRSSWHMFPVGLLFGLGLETASEVALLALSAGAAVGGRPPLAAVLALPLLFAAGMSTLDTLDGVLMARAYSWAFEHPARRLYYNLTTTVMTVVVAVFVGTVYLAALLTDATGWGGPLAAYAGIGDHFQVLGYVVVGAFLLTWAAAAAYWRIGRVADRLARLEAGSGSTP